MWCLLKGNEAATLFLVVADANGACLERVVYEVKKSLEVRVKDARMPAFYNEFEVDGGCEGVRELFGMVRWQKIQGNQ